MAGATSVPEPFFLYPRVFFELGEHTEVPTFVVRWPAGTEQSVSVDQVNCSMLVEEPGES